MAYPQGRRNMMVRVGAAPQQQQQYLETKPAKLLGNQVTNYDQPRMQGGGPGMQDHVAPNLAMPQGGPHRSRSRSPGATIGLGGISAAAHQQQQQHPGPFYDNEPPAGLRGPPSSRLVAQMVDPALANAFGGQQRRSPARDEQEASYQPVSYQTQQYSMLGGVQHNNYSPMRASPVVNLTPVNSTPLVDPYSEGGGGGSTGRSGSRVYIDQIHPQPTSADQSHSLSAVQGGHASEYESGGGHSLPTVSPDSDLSSGGGGSTSSGTAAAECEEGNHVLSSPTQGGDGGAGEMAYDNDGLIPATEEPYVTYIYWDYDNVHPPGGEANFVKFYISMIRALEQLKVKQDGVAGAGKRVVYSRHFVDAKCFVRGSGTSDNLELQAQKVRVDVHVAGQKKEATDRLIDRSVKETLKDFKKMFGDEDQAIPHHVVIVSSDTDFIDCVSNLEDEGVTTTVVYNAKAGSEHDEVLNYHASATLPVHSFLPQELAALVTKPTPAARTKPTPLVNTQLKTAASKNVANNNSDPNTPAADAKPEHVPQRVVATSKSASSSSDKTYPVDGSYIPESLLIRNRALDYLDTHQYRQGKKCTNPRDHDIQDCSFIHYRRNPNRKR